LKDELDAAVKEAKSKVSSDDVEVLKAAKTQFEAKLHKLSESVYKNAGQAAQGAGSSSQAQGSSSNNAKQNSGSSSDSSDDVVDAEFDEASSNDTNTKK
jgi:hypothetical protein